MKTATHKRTRRKGKVIALCADKRAKKLHNWWERVDCSNCWKARIPKEGDECVVEDCRETVRGFVNGIAYCSDHEKIVKEMHQ